MADRWGVLWDPDWWFENWKIVIDNANHIIERSTWNERSEEFLGKRKQVRPSFKPTRPSATKEMYRWETGQDKVTPEKDEEDGDQEKVDTSN